MSATEIPTVHNHPSREAMAAALDAYRRESNFARTLRRGAPVSRFLLISVVVVHLGFHALTMVNEDALLQLTDADPFVTNLMLGAKINPLVWAGQWWRISSAMFLHANLLHLVLNGYAIFIIGPLLEKLYGSRRLLVIYVFSGLVGGIASLLFTEGMSVGASGAIFGLVGALLVFGVKSRGLVPPRVSRAFGVGLLPWVGINLVIGCIPGLNIDNGAHVGGLLGGLLITLFLATSLKGPPTGVRRVGLEIAYVFSWLVIAFGIVFMLWQVMACAGSGAQFTQCHPVGLIGL